MATNQEILDQAAIELGKINEGESLDTTAGGEADQALQAMNDMLEEWRIRDIDINWFVQDTLTATCPIPSWSRSGIVSNVAVALGATFDITPSQLALLKADQGRKAIAHVIFNQHLDQGQDMSHLNRGAGNRHGWDIETDTF